FTGGAASYHGSAVPSPDSDKAKWGADTHTHTHTTHTPTTPHAHAHPHTHTHTHTPPTPTHKCCFSSSVNPPLFCVRVSESNAVGWSIQISDFYCFSTLRT